MPILNGPFPEPLPRPLPEPLPFPNQLPRPIPKPFPFPKPFPYPWFAECIPKILVVTDGLNYQQMDGFGLTEFVDTLRASTIHSMMPIVTTARFNPSPMATLSYAELRCCYSSHIQLQVQRCYAWPTQITL